MQSLTLPVALERLAHDPAAILAGGTDFYPALRDNAAPERVLDVSRIDGLRAITRTDSGWTIGAASTWTDVINAPLPAAFDGLKTAARQVGSVQIQNAATLAGNLCNASPAADGVPPLLTLDASVELASIKGSRTMPLQDFILGPRSTALQADELMVAIHVPAPGVGACSEFFKLGARRYLVISIAMASVLLEADEQGCLSDVRLAVGSCSAVAQRLHELEQVLLGQSLQADLVSLIMPGMYRVLSPLDDVRGSAAYRLSAVHQMICRMLINGTHSLRVQSSRYVPSRGEQP